jgi:hypothetical protein
LPEVPLISSGTVRLSRPRVLVRIALLAFVGVYLLLRSVAGRAHAKTLPLPEAALASRLAFIFELLGILALLTAAMTLFALRPRRTTKTLDLSPRGDETGPPGGGA